MFEDAALVAGCAYGSEGKALSGMGVAAGDFDNSGAESLFVTNLMGETNSLFHNDGRGSFDDATLKYGLAIPSLLYTGFGTGWFDFDNDGWLDLFVANEAVETVPSLRGQPFPYRQKNRLYRNRGGVRFEDISEISGPATQVSAVGRSAAFGDLNNDGGMDIVVTNHWCPVKHFADSTKSNGTSGLAPIS